MTGYPELNVLCFYFNKFSSSTITVSKFVSFPWKSRTSGHVCVSSVRVLWSGLPLYSLLGGQGRGLCPHVPLTFIRLFRMSLSISSFPLLYEIYLESYDDVYPRKTSRLCWCPFPLPVLSRMFYLKRRSLHPFS